ncbi:MAG: hypothetical protein NTX64_15640, partial [Elusimicrobia bacterium]|nr:hypothetical protein [Elusimicrobiota bacterium]
IDTTKLVQSFNQANGLVVLTSAGKLPALDGSSLINVVTDSALDTDKIWIGDNLGQADSVYTYGDATITFDSVNDSAKITLQPLVVDTGKLAADAVTGASILDASIDTTKLVQSFNQANGLVVLTSAGKLPALDGSSLLNVVTDSALDTDKIWIGDNFGQVDSVYTYGDATITFDSVNDSAKITLQPLAVDTGKLAADAVDNTKILDGSVQTSKLAADSVTGDKILNGSVNSAKLAADVFTNVVVQGGHLTATGAAPTATNGLLNCGDSATVSVTGTDIAGSITITLVTTDAGLSAESCWVEITFNKPFAAAPKAIVLFPTTAATLDSSGAAAWRMSADARPFMYEKTASLFGIRFAALESTKSDAVANVLTLTYDYIVIE